MRKLFLILSAIGLLSIDGNAQAYSRLKYEFIYGIGASNFMGDIAAPSDPNKLVWVRLFNTIGPVGNAALRYNIQGRHYANGKIVLGQLYAEDPTGVPGFWDRGMKMSSFFTEISVNYEFFIFQEKRRRTIYRQLGETSLKNLSVPTYLFLGIGGLVNVGTFSDIQQKVVISEFNFNVAPVVPLGIGFQTRLDRNTMFNLEAGYRLAISDNVDFANGRKEDNKGIYGAWFDQYQFITISLSHKIRSNSNGLPRFRRRR